MACKDFVGSCRKLKSSVAIDAKRSSSLGISEQPTAQEEGSLCHAELWSKALTPEVVCFVYAQDQCCPPVRAPIISFQSVATREDALTVEKCKVAICTIKSPLFQVYLLLSVVTASPSILAPSKCT